MNTRRFRYFATPTIALLAASLIASFDRRSLASDCVRVVPCNAPNGDCGKPYCNNVIPPTDNPVPPPDEEPPGASCGDSAIGVGGLPWNGIAIHPDTCGSCGDGGGKGDPSKYWDGLGSGGGMTIFPVTYAEGLKVYTTTDLNVPLPGRDFVLSR